jgi:hypothetical protein
MGLAITLLTLLTHEQMNRFEVYLLDIVLKWSFSSVI